MIINNKIINRLIMTDIIEIKNMDGLEYLLTIPDGSINLILTDPPYIISKGDWNEYIL